MNVLKMAAAATLLVAATAAHAQKTTIGAGAEPAQDPVAEPTLAAPDAAAPASTMVSAQDPQGIVTAMQALGYTATLGVDNANDPMISGDLNGTAYNIYFFGCEQNANCQWLVFSAGFDLPNGSTMDAMNQWNQSNLVGQAFLDAEQDPFLNYFVTTTGGLSTDNFADVVDWWRVALAQFEDAVGV